MNILRLACASWTFEHHATKKEKTVGFAKKVLCSLTIDTYRYPNSENTWTTGVSSFVIIRSIGHSVYAVPTDVLKKFLPELAEKITYGWKNPKIQGILPIPLFLDGENNGKPENPIKMGWVGGYCTLFLEIPTLENTKKPHKNQSILLMAEILQQFIGSLSHYS